MRARWQIARSCSVAQGTVSQYLKRAQQAGVTWPLPEGWDDRQLESALFGGTPRRAYETRKPQPDFARLHQELQRHPHLTLQLAWEEYRQVHPDGYAYAFASSTKVGSHRFTAIERAISFKRQKPEGLSIRGN